MVFLKTLNKARIKALPKSLTLGEWGSVIYWWNCKRPTLVCIHKICWVTSNQLHFELLLSCNHHFTDNKFLYLDHKSLLSKPCIYTSVCLCSPYNNLRKPCWVENHISIHWNPLHDACLPILLLDYNEIRSCPTSYVWIPALQRLLNSVLPPLSTTNYRPSASHL